MENKLAFIWTSFWDSVLFPAVPVKGVEGGWAMDPPGGLDGGVGKEPSDALGPDVVHGSYDDGWWYGSWTLECPGRPVQWGVLGTCKSSPCYGWPLWKHEHRQNEPSLWPVWKHEHRQNEPSFFPQQHDERSAGLPKLPREEGVFAQIFGTADPLGLPVENDSTPLPGFPVFRTPVVKAGESETSVFKCGAELPPSHVCKTCQSPLWHWLQASLGSQMGEGFGVLAHHSGEQRLRIQCGNVCLGETFRSGSWRVSDLHQRCMHVESGLQALSWNEPVIYSSSSTDALTYTGHGGHLLKRTSWTFSVNVKQGLGASSSVNTWSMPVSFSSTSWVPTLSSRTWWDLYFKAEWWESWQRGNQLSKLEHSPWKRCESWRRWCFLMFSLHTLLDRYFAGCMLSALFSRARWSDLSPMQSFGFDIMETDDGPFGFVEGRTRIHKTSKTAEKKALYLPFVAQIEGAGDRAWALAWKEVLEEVASQRDPWHPLRGLPPCPTTSREWPRPRRGHEFTQFEGYDFGMVCQVWYRW